MQQDAFDKIDSISPMKRQQYMLNLVMKVCDAKYNFESFEKVAPFFKKIINILKQMNYSEFESENFKNFEIELDSILKERVA